MFSHNINGTEQLNWKLVNFGGRERKRESLYSQISTECPAKA